MATPQENVQTRLQHLLNNELSSSSNDESQVKSAYECLINILQTSDTRRQLDGHHELLFACISEIILTPYNQHFSDDQLCHLLELVSNARVLTMSQNQTIDGWLQNMDDRTFEKPDELDDDDDDLYEDATDSEGAEELAEEETLESRCKKSVDNSASQQSKSKISNESSLRSGSKSAATKMNQSVPRLLANQRADVVKYLTDRRQNDRKAERSNSNPTASSKADVKQSGNNDFADKLRKKSKDETEKRCRSSPFDNKYGVDLRKYDCYICGEYGHVQYDCPTKQTKAKASARDCKQVNPVDKKKPRKSNSSSSESSVEAVFDENSQNRPQHLYHQTTTLIDTCQTADKISKSFDSYFSLIKQLEKQYGKNLPTILLSKEPMFYHLFCHVAQHDFLFTNDLYGKLYALRHTLLPKKHHLLDEDRSVFCRQRILMSLNTISDHIKNANKIQQRIFNDFQEYIIRSTTPLPLVLYDLTKHIFKSKVQIDAKYLEYFGTKILFDMKRNVLSEEQFNELRPCFDIRMKRIERNWQKQIWKERLLLLKNDTIPAELALWISDFEEILKRDDAGPINNTDTTIIDNAMWYFAVLFMASCGHLNRRQYEHVLKLSVESRLFNARQKSYFRYYLNQGQAPITLCELKQIKIQLKSLNVEDKKTAYEQMKIILNRPKPEFVDEEASCSTGHPVEEKRQQEKSQDIIPIIDNNVLSYLITLIEMVCADVTAISLAQSNELLDTFLNRSTIVRPLSDVEKARLTSYYSRPISLDELKMFCASTKFDLSNFLSLIKQRPLSRNDELYNLFTQTVVKIFENRQEYSGEQCQVLYDLIKQNVLGKSLYRTIKDAYTKFRLNKPDVPNIQRSQLSQLLNGILQQDQQAHLEFLNLLEGIAPVMDLKENTLELEINRCLLSTTVMIIVENNLSNNYSIHQRLNALMEKHPSFFSMLLNEQQQTFIKSRLAGDIDKLIHLIKTNTNAENFARLIKFIQCELKDKESYVKLVNFLLSTFENELLSIKQTLEISNLLVQDTKFSNKNLRNLLQYLIDLLQLDIHCSPRVLLKSVEDPQVIGKLITMLRLPSSKFAVVDWKWATIDLLRILFERGENCEQLRTIAQQSPMIQQSALKLQLQSYWTESSDKQSVTIKTPAAVPKRTDKKIDSSAVHSGIAHGLELNDVSAHASVVKQLHACLLDEQIPSDISLKEFIQALQVIVSNPQSFREISPREWERLIANNRGKIFANDAQCDQLLMEILLTRLNMPSDLMKLMSHSIQSKNGQERRASLQKLLALLRNTQIKNDNLTGRNLPTISIQFYNMIRHIVFDEKFNDQDVRLCLEAASKSWLLNDDHRERLDRI